MIAWLVRHPTTVLLAAVSVFVFGMMAYVGLPREAAPDIPIPVVTVTTVYPGVSPEDIEGLVTIPLENEIAGLKDIDRLSSTSSEGVSVLAIEFEPDVVIEDALQRVRDRVNRVLPRLPDDAEQPEIREVSFSDLPILIVNIAGPVDEEVLQELGERLQDEAERVPGVLDARLSGGLEREIQVLVDPVRLAHYGLGLRDVVNAIANENANVPGGEVDAGRSTILLRVPGEFEDPARIEDVPIKRRGDRPVFVRDIGRVVDAFAERTTYARMNGQPSVSLSITKRSGANTVALADAIRELVAEQAAGWPEAVGWRILGDQSENIRHMVSELENNIVTALLLVVGVIFFFMGMRNSLFVALAIPLSMFASFLVIQWLGYTLNMIVLFSLILALGMLVDNAIVIVENIYRHMEEGLDRLQASIVGTREVAGAVAASTATTVAAFFPLVFWTGIMGKFMGFLPKTLIIVLVASLVVAVGVLPVLTARFMRPVGGASELDPERLGPVMARYRRLLEFSIRRRYLSAGLGAVSLLLTLVAYAFLNHGTEFFPDTEPDRATISVRLSDGSALDATDRVVRRVEAVLRRLANVDVYVAETGVAGGGSPLEAAQAAPNQARISVDFLPDRNSAEPGEQVRVEPTHRTIDAIRAGVASIPGARIVVEKERMGPPVGAPIEVEVRGPTFHGAGRLAQRVERRLAEVEGVTDLRDDYRVGRPELRLVVDRGAAQRVGLSTAAIGDAVRSAIAGARAATFREGDEETDIVVRLDPAAVEDLQSVLDLRLPGREDTSPDTFPVPLSAVARYELAGGSGAIQHIDQDLVVTITGDVLEGYNENAVRAAVAALLDDIEVPQGYHLRLGGADDEQRNAQAFLSRAFLVAIALILLVLVTQFDSLVIPGIILSSVLLSLIGVLWGLILTGTSFGVIMTGIGVISLAGVVVNNAIVLLDYVQQLRAQGMDVHDALVRAGLVRFRPVMLTAITTVLGLVPMALGLSVDFQGMRILVGGRSAQWWGPMAVAVIFGLSFATLLTLVMVPTFYSIVEDLRGRVGRRLARGGAASAVGAAAKVVLLSLAVAGTARAGEGPRVGLDEVLRAAEAHDLGLAVARTRAEQADTLRGQALALLSPKVQANGGYHLSQIEVVFDPADTIPPELVDLVGDVGEPIVIQPKRYWEGSVTVSQPLFDGQALPALRGSRHLREAAGEDVRSGRLAARARAARAFHGLVAAIEGERLAEDGLETARAHEALAGRQAEAGLAPPRALLQARLGVAQAERRLEEARRSRRLAAQALHLLTGLPEDLVPVAPEGETPAPGSEAEALATAMERRPDVRAARERLAAAELQLRATRLDWLPSVDGSFTTVFTQNTGFSDEQVYWVAAVTGSWLLWDGGFRLAQDRSDRAGVEAARLGVRQAREQAEREVREAWLGLEAARRAIEVAEREVALAREGHARAVAALEAGSATWLEAEQARVDLAAARFALLRARLDRELAAIDLRAAMGVE